MRILSLVLVILIHQSLCQDEGGSCEHFALQQYGVCQPLSKCPAAIEQIKNRVYPQNCGGFVGTIPIICCVTGGGGLPSPTAATTQKPTARPTTTTTQRSTGPLKVGDKAQRKCGEYSALTYKLINPVVLLIGSQKENVSNCPFTAVPLIVGGEPSKPKEFPHMALIGFDDDNGEPSYQCGGTLISERYVLTAAHCMFSAELGEAKHIRLGEYVLDSTDDERKKESSLQQFRITERIKHPDYKPPSQYNDIALVKLDKDVKFNDFVRPACLNTFTDRKEKKAIATGWGKTDYTGERSNTLLKVTLEYYTQDQCNSSYRTSINRRLKYGIVPETQLCAGSSERKDTCQGDSGGPLQVYNMYNKCLYDIVGVTSFGKACGVANVPGVYTRVTRYVQWIENIVWPS